jgi:exonuclease SbcD
MRILHTSDWHIGKRLGKYDRLEEQAEVLDEIISLCESEKVELVLIAGDIFDTYTPSAEAEELFYKKVKKLAGENRSVLVISGNHDDGVRLSATAPLASDSGVYIVGNSRAPLPITSERKVKPIVSGKGYAIFENDRKERAFVSMLPYPNEARFKEEKSELSYVDRMKKWIDEGESGNVEKLPSVFMAHIFVAGGKVSESEREIDLGGARAVPVDALPHSDYIALGHLHKKQRMGGGNCYYSGSPLQYSFDESSDKGVKVFDLTGDGVLDLRDVPLTKGRKLVRLEADSFETAELLLEKYPTAFVEMKLLLSAPLTSAAAAKLAAHENLVSLVTEITTDTALEFQSRKGLSDEQLFDAYYKATYNAEPKKELKELFLTTLAETQET